MLRIPSSWARVSLACLAMLGLAPTAVGCFSECEAACTNRISATAKLTAPDGKAERLRFRFCVEDTCRDVALRPKPSLNDAGSTGDGATSAPDADAGQDASACLPYLPFDEASGQALDLSSCPVRREGERLVVTIVDTERPEKGFDEDLRIRLDAFDKETGATLLSKEATTRSKKNEVCGNECAEAEVSFE